MPIASTMDQKRRRHNLWEIVSYLWLKFVNISEEYELLQEKWIFLREAHPPAISIGKRSAVFKALNKSMSRTSRLFKEFGFEKSDYDDYDKFVEHDLALCDNIRKELFAQVSYVGLLKLAYLQRTVSHEVVNWTGFAYGPEKTIGSEIVYIAADSIAKAYASCVEMKKRPTDNTPLFQWDGLVTFVPPLQVSGFFGALSTPSSLGLFHISLSEEEKSQIAPLLMIAHEVAHISAMDPDKTSGARDEFAGLLLYVLFHVGSILTSLMEAGTLPRTSECSACAYNVLNWDSQLQLSSYFLREIFADVIALKIAGPNTAEIMLDEGFSTHFAIMRAGCISRYMRLTARNRSEINRANHVDFRSHDIGERIITSKKMINRKFPMFPHLAICPTCLSIAGRTIGECIRSYETRFPSSISAFIKHGKEFSIDKKEEKRIISSLLRGITQTSVDPRKIMHCYYEAFRKTKRKGEKPRYLVALYSLAFNDA